MFKIISNPLAISLTINAPIQKVWDNIAQWEKQGDWMLQTRVWVTSHINEGVGTEISAFTGISRLGILDTMIVTKWEPPFTCDVIHTGKVIKGTGSFKLAEISPGVTSFDWSEEVLAPQIIFWLIRPGLYAGVRISLARFARQFR